MLDVYLFHLLFRSHFTLKSIKVLTVMLSSPPLVCPTQCPIRFTGHRNWRLKVLWCQSWTECHLMWRSRKAKRVRKIRKAERGELQDWAAWTLVLIQLLPAEWHWLSVRGWTRAIRCKQVGQWKRETLSHATGRGGDWRREIESRKDEAQVAA